MEELIRALKAGAFWGIASVLLQWYFGTLGVAEFALNVQTVLVSAITLPALASAIIIRELNAYFISGLLGNNSVVFVFHLLLSINIGVLLGLICCSILYFNKYLGVGKAGNESIELQVISG
ncbi:Uncharacterised protein [uncultured archaeon]|nr:Uncharacterised protein [uncultured archaeon]